MKDILKNNINNAINSLNQKDINQAIDYIYSSLSEIEIDSKIFTNVEIMRYANLKEGDIVRTKGYYKDGDGGAATYEIMTYDNWLNSLEEKLRIRSKKLNNLLADGKDVYDKKEWKYYRKAITEDCPKPYWRNI